MSDKQGLYSCDACGYFTRRISEWHRHIATAKHIKNSSYDCGSSDDDTLTTYVCEKCDKMYSAKSSYWYHKKRCTAMKELPIANAVEADNTSLTPVITNEAFMAVFSQNTTLTNYLIEQNKMLTEQNKEMQASVNHSHNTITTNSHNTNSQTFNLQFFLNETCKNAMNLNDFIDQIEITMEDLDDMRRLGYSHGVSNILVKNLDRVALDDRPLHSNDVKRELFYIRNNNKWIKETDDYQYIIKAIKCIVKKNMGQLIKWRELNPEFNDPSTKACEHHHQMIVNMFNGSDEEAQKNYRKIIRTVANKTPIPKV